MNLTIPYSTVFLQLSSDLMTIDVASGRWTLYGVVKYRYHMEVNKINYLPCILVHMHEHTI